MPSGSATPWPTPGWSAGDRVAFLDRNGIEYFEVFFGCALLGAVSVAVNWRLAPAEMAAIIEDAGARSCSSAPTMRPRSRRSRAQVACVRTWVPLGRVRRLAGLRPPRAD